MRWTAKQVAAFTHSYGRDGVHAETLWRPMAQRLCPEVLHAFDRDWNWGPEPLGPNWHGFADKVEEAIKAAHAVSDETALSGLYTFANWAFLEPSSNYLPNETMTSIGQGLCCDLQPSLWVARFPPEITQQIIRYA